ncbi:MAG: bacillithiol biosynthesis cysteine-adding enzyme BshC [Chitinophagales bacterium]|nr:bacillithiol biosynthesis cysteine-adding enzyme BshC [Chitinophagales bacterium]
MKKTSISYKATGYFSKPVIDYLENAEAIHPFFQYVPEISSVLQAIQNRNSFPTNRKVLADVLNVQHATIKGRFPTDYIFQNIESLNQSNTFTVTTAHQPNLFLGPLYLIYKIISTINLSRKLNTEYPDYHFVPVYWMGSEDHDKEELNHIYLFGKTLTWNTDQQGAFGRMKTQSLSVLINELELILGNYEEAKNCITLLRECYLQEDTIAAATKRFIYHFFAADGLLIIDGDDPNLKKLFIPVAERELFSQISFRLINESLEQFTRNYISQIHPREINLFFLENNIRERIVKENNQWKILNTELSFTEDEMKGLLFSFPEKFSPNVVLRPVYQEMVLPDIAFLGGGAEITYWMQLKSLFSFLNIPFPMILLRNSVLWIEKISSAKMGKLSIADPELFLPAEALIKKYIDEQSGELISLKKEQEALNNIMDQAIEKSIEIDQSLKGAFEAERVKMIKALTMLEEKLRRATKKKEEVAIQQIQSLKGKLFPNNELQERHENFLSFYMKYGNQFFEELKSNLNPLERKFTILSEE